MIVSPCGDQNAAKKYLKEKWVASVRLKILNLDVDLGLDLDLYLDLDLDLKYIVSIDKS